MKSYILNHDYILRHDEKRTYIVRKSSNNDSSSGWISIIHPVQAMILSFFSESITYQKAVVDLSFFLDTDQKEIEKILDPFIANEEAFFTEYNNQKFEFPKNVLIESSSNKSPLNIYKVEDFGYEELDFDTKRMYSGPLNITFMPNNICATNCIYCYADKSYQVKEYLSFDRLKKIIDEARKKHILTFNIVGGEVFTYPQWGELLQYSMDCGYEPLRISTKVPLSREDVVKLKKTGIKKIQISLDTLIEENLIVLLRTNKEYHRKMLSFIRFLDEENFDIQIQTILTKYNCTEGDMLSIFDFIKSFKNISQWALRPAFASIYNGNDFVPSLSQINDVFDAVEPLKSQITIDYDRTFLDRGYVTAIGGSENFKGAECSANRSHIFILPDGKVTICEQLYWKQNFIVGDLNEQSIEDVWRSEKSLWFANLGKSELSDHNPCKICEIFDSCYKNMNRCWSEVIKAYGDENWDYPDPRCKLAPEMKTNLIYQ